MQTQKAVSARRLVTVSQLANEQPALTEGGIRWDLFNRKTNGLEACGAIIKRGRRILVDPDLYVEWMASGQTGTGDAA